MSCRPCWIIKTQVCTHCSVNIHIIHEIENESGHTIGSIDVAPNHTKNECRTVKLHLSTLSINHFLMCLCCTTFCTWNLSFSLMINVYLSFNCRTFWKFQATNLLHSLFDTYYVTWAWPLLGFSLFIMYTVWLYHKYLIRSDTNKVWFTL